MHIDVLTLFPEMFGGVLGSSILGRAASVVSDPAHPDEVRPPVVSFAMHQLRDYTLDKHGKVDKPSYGGGPGLVIQCDPVYEAVTAIETMRPEKARRIHLSPQGRVLDQRLAEELAKESRLLLMCGHYEGFDQRVLDELEPEEISIGDYVLSGGELAAMILIDAIVRLVPGALGDADSAHFDSFSPGAERLLDHPHYTKPREWRGRVVPDVLLSGDHARIEAWRKAQALQATSCKRPDLLS